MTNVSPSSPALATTPDDVLQFWFGLPGEAVSEEAVKRWFAKEDAFDAEIRLRFGALIEQALGGGLQDWAWNAGSALARVIVLDQFPRNVWRAQPRAFAGDALALQAAREMVLRGQDLQLPAARRMFAYLPFEHAEDLAAQRESLRLFERLAAEVPAMADYLDYARRHHAVIERFGRFPHRNAALGRESTAEEAAFLQQPGSGF